MIQSFFLPGRLPGANECLWKHYRVMSRLKRKYQTTIGKVLKGLDLKPMRRVNLEFTWSEPNKRRDLDNIAFGQKFILDALVHCGILKGDGQRYVTGLRHNLCTVESEVGVYVYMEGEYD